MAVEGDDLLAAELESVAERPSEAHLLTLPRGQSWAGGPTADEGAERELKDLPGACLVLGVGSLARDAALWARLDASGALQVLVRNAAGQDRLLAEVDDYLRYPESLLAVEADGERYSAEALLGTAVLSSSLGRPQEMRQPPGQEQEDLLPPLFSHPWDERESLPDMLAEAGLDDSPVGRWA